MLFRGTLLMCDPTSCARTRLSMISVIYIHSCICDLFYYNSQAFVILVVDGLKSDQGKTKAENCFQVNIIIKYIIRIDSCIRLSLGQIDIR